MDRDEAEKLLSGLVDQLAAIEHDRWSRWQRYVHEKGERLPNGALLLPADLVRHWDFQIETRYVELSEAEKASDREQVRQYLSIIAAALTGGPP